MRQVMFRILIVVFAAIMIGGVGVFVLGGLAFGAAAWAFMRTLADRRSGRVAGLVGALGALGLSVITLLVGIG